MNERDLQILAGLAMAPKTGLSAGEIGRRFLGRTGKRPDRPALSRLRWMRSRGWVQATVQDVRGWRRFWYITDAGLDALAAARAAA